MDHLSKKKRSWNMSRIRSKDTGPEKIVRSFLHRQGFRFRLHVKDLPGKPDIVLPKFKTVIFVHGCFWHRHSRCRLAATPKSNVAFWRQKLDANVTRFKRVSQDLKRAGWRVVVIWECGVGSGDFSPIDRLLLI
ncbi:MAG: DNA mismatch endonuclease Vsr [Candidatus Omnitrophica bacterium]|nr:DNA mismatch endonuclease Vsr [Candidatus Omnitrophota bacterium]